MPAPLASPAPPGFLSPAAFPFPNGPYGLPNDAPTLAPPYVIGTTRITASVSSFTVTVTAPTAPGDAISVMFGNTGGAAPVISCTDTKNNAYSIYQRSSNANAGQCVAANPVPLAIGDVMTITFGGSSAGRNAIAVGIPVAAFGGSGFVAVDSVNSAPSNTAIIGGTGSGFAAGLAAIGTTPEIALVSFIYTTANGPVNWPPPWNPMVSLPANGSFTFTAAWLPVTNLRPAPRLQLVFPNAGNMCGELVTFLAETRIAPNRAPDMPPGMQSPGAWQYQPLSPPEGPWSAHYNPGPNKWTETLPAAPASSSALTRSAGKLIAATPRTAGALARTIARLRTFAATPRAAGAIARTIAQLRTFAATPRAAGKLARTAGKTLAATPRAAGKLARSTAWHLAATAATAADIIRGRAKRLAARITAAARLIVSGSNAPVFSLGVPQTEWNVSISTIGLSHLATQYVIIPVAATRAGLSYNPTSDTVQFAFAATATYVPQSGDWVTGVWETDTTNLLYPYAAKCLVGPSGTTTLGIGTYVMYVRITDNPEVPVLIAGYLQVS